MLIFINNLLEFVNKYSVNIGMPLDPVPIPCSTKQSSTTVNISPKIWGAQDDLTLTDELILNTKQIWGAKRGKVNQFEESEVMEVPHGGHDCGYGARSFWGERIRSRIRREEN